MATRSRRCVLRATLDEERGSLLPVFGATIIGLVAGGMLLFLLGYATVSRANAQTAADAAALAAVGDMREQIRELVLGGALEEPHELVVSQAMMRDAAEDYARRNDATLEDLVRQGFRATATVVSDEQADDPAGRGRATAQLSLAFQRTPAGSRPVGVHCPIPESELDELAASVGMESVPDDSALRRYSGCGTLPGVSVAHLTTPMKRAILRLEQRLGRGIQLSAGYRSPAYYQQRCAMSPESALCEEMVGHAEHSHGRAITVPNGAQVGAAVTAYPSIGLCRPPSTGAHRFVSVEPGSACDGRTGTLHRSQVYGGDIDAFIRSEILLVE